MDKITWQAYEFEQPERQTNWFVSLWILAAALVVVAIILKSYLLAVFIIIAAGVLNIYALKEPHQYTFVLDVETLKIGEKEHILNNFKSFWIFERESGNVLSLEGRNILNLHMEIPLAEVDPETVRHIISPAVPEKEHNESTIDALARRLKF
ncbi:MAG: hypothetical protein HYT38_02595 [Candidatus Sungbacteria bacterium]|uniref:DUF5673 domain-containing protein n=1 Tax=Candidatus Sungiibacteriota bacterium TaxID=2750080 RepID=A0A931YDW7_9BACT|nr:hypothetical protein [Candidatus Sungbacteria bacterium]MBI2466059.1 hypothetical protein [Candidatus Sungbacteria bacterium]